MQPPENILYLLGAGATHAEILTLEENAPDETFRAKNGLRIADVSKRVIGEAQRDPWFKENEGIFAAAKGSFNIELLISLFENNQLPDEKVRDLKRLVGRDYTAPL